MFVRFVTIFLPLIGILLCPFTCRGTGMVSERVAIVASHSCCSLGHGSSGCEADRPDDGCPQAPGHRECQHECVNNALVESPTRIPDLDRGLEFFVFSGLFNEDTGLSSGSIDAAALSRHATHPDTPSGSALRVTIASLLL